MLVPRAALTLGDRLYEEQIAALRLRRSRLPALDRLEVLMPIGVTFEADLGDDVSLDLDGGDEAGGGGNATVFTGTLSGIARRPGGLRLTCHDGGLALSRYRPVVALENLTVAEIIEALCADAEVDAAVDIESATLAFYAMDGHATALQEIARLAELAGGGAAFDGDGTLHVSEAGGPDAELALKYGRELLELTLEDEEQPTAAITIVGEGAGSPDSPEARWIVQDFLAGGAPKPGTTARRRVVAELRSTDDTETAAVALAERRSAAARPVRLKTWLMPTLAPGTRLEIADLPDPLTLDDCRVTQIVSTLRSDGVCASEIWATGRPQQGGGLLGALLGAAGGLL